MKRIAIVNQRYGLEVNGGSEYYTRLIAEHLSKYYDIEVLTTTALNYDTWENYYPVGNTEVNGIKVRRFPVKTNRNMLRFRIVNKATGWMRKAGLHLDTFWVREQGPNTPKLIQYIKEHENDYNGFVFVTYLYYTTVMGLPQVAKKSILIPTAHDEPYINLRIYQNLFNCPKGIIYLTEEEQKIVEKKFHNNNIPSNILAVGVDVPKELMDKEHKNLQIEKFRKEFAITSEYIIYVGRVDYGKKCDEMFRFFLEYKDRNPSSSLQLLVIGKDMMGVPSSSYIRYLGFVSEEAKFAGVAGAKFLWMPSQFESLSIALLEGMALGIPAIVNGNCEVLKGHCQKSKGAVFYRDEEEFIGRMQEMLSLSDEEYFELSMRATRYVETNYRWDLIERKLFDFLERCLGKV